MVGTTPYLHQHVCRRILQESHNTLVPPGYTAATIRRNSKEISLPIDKYYAVRYINHVEHQLAIIPLKHWQRMNIEVVKNEAIIYLRSQIKVRRALVCAPINING